MNTLLRNICGVFSLIVALSLTTGCDKAATPPEPFTAEELPGAIEQAFASAKPEIKEVATQFVSLIKAKNYPKAFESMQSLSSKSGLSEEQHAVLGRASLTLNSLLQAAQASGDQKAAKTIQNYQYNK